ncbi:MAG: aromatic-ring-hydroxylating dioxygenase subunit beta [Alphaproteobacteria bacterium]|jgi:3-phenylpropionate/cinnamic acid dioxygenase small subunit|nr:aromatic-ring-hydroxylating dioxygenase subunit beta [Alphaproteobacteria bacterium]MDP6876467.1 aromatic-ring-hydroxylating dioxygenase subunit beta [Alphaproteobacteria bacterium]
MAELYGQVRDLLYLEADLLDRQCWDDWLALYAEDCVYWVPSWLSEDELGDDPEMQVNTIYIVGKPGLAARLHRISSGQAYAQAPLTRTSHLVDTVRLLEHDDDKVLASAKWMTLSADSRTGKQIRGGWYEYELRRVDGGLLIGRKKIVLLEDVIDGAVDIHQI